LCVLYHYVVLFHSAPVKTMQTVNVEHRHGEWILLVSGYCWPRLLMGLVVFSVPTKIWSEIKRYQDKYTRNYDTLALLWAIKQILWLWWLL